MMILHIISSSLESGAGKGSFLLHKELLKKGLDSRILVLRGVSSKKLKIDVILNNPFKILGYKFLTIINHNITRIFFLKKIENFDHGFIGFGCDQHPWYKSADIIHLHWINGLLSINQISKIAKPLVWTMRDMWPFTVGYHYYYQDKEPSNFLLRIYKKYKTKKFKNNNILFVGISNWISNKAKESQISKRHEIKTILNVADSEVFYPNEKDYLYRKYSISKKKKIILLGAIDLEVKYKGLGRFIKAINFLNPEEIEIVCFGNIKQKSLSKLNRFSIRNIGYISSNAELSKVYSSSYLFAATSIVEAFGKTILESMLCGTPCVVFDNSGPGELVIHKVTGYKAKSLSSRSFSEGIKWFIDLDNNAYKKISKNCLKHANYNYRPSLAAEKYAMIYEKLLN